ncbi:DUF3365 domain-containing protein [Hymenobacter sp. J193]|uniref:Tll0287-like domain-containing protein n=1 Tax=Hymenobacter sp. J193 TaxID=2898429 RepID=UPI002150816F|nr:DUF3365 domain-containing protein [Hymenobacter sp. J193]MCR5888222.1 DUF3365 domain-containing protein [Hymenobacter sp. J193]
MRFIFCAALAISLLTGCRPDQIEHLRNTKELAIEAENWQVKRILPKDLLRATRWAGDSLTSHADRELRRVLAEKLQAGGVAAALPYCRPETYASIDSLARVLEAAPRRVSSRPRNPGNRATLSAAELTPDTLRTVRRPSAEVFFYQRPIVLSDAQCLRCHGTPGTDIAAADYALLQKQYPQDQATGYKLGQVMGAWQVQFRRAGVAEFYTMKTRKIMKRRKLF